MKFKQEDMLTTDALRKLGFYLEQALTKKLPAASFTLSTNVIFKGYGLQQALQYRMVDTVNAVATLVEAKLIVPATMIVRSAFELLALMHYFENETREFLEKGDPEKYHKWLFRALFGSKLPDAKVKSVHILEYLREIDSAHKDFIWLYDQLSEVVHPNFEGVMGAYANIDIEKYVITIEKQHVATSPDKLLASMKTVMLLFSAKMDNVTTMLHLINQKMEKREGDASVSVNDFMPEELKPRSES